MIDDEPFGFQHIVKDRGAPTWLESRPVAQAFAQSRLVATLGPVLQGRAVPSAQSAETASGEPKAREDFVYDGASRFGL